MLHLQQMCNTEKLTLSTQQKIIKTRKKKNVLKTITAEIDVRLAGLYNDSQLKDSIEAFFLFRYLQIWQIV